MNPQAEAPGPPTLYEWAGGMEKFEAWTDLFYQRVHKDTVLEPVFHGMSAEHARHVAHFIAEVFRGPATYSQEGGSHYDMIHHHLGKHLTEAQRRRWIDLILDTADAVGLPDDPEFRSAVVGYLEWGSRLAVINSKADVVTQPQDAPMPTWGWGETGGPYVP
ncbi:group II truncated hemoglobin [Spirosoma sp.]|uniref:group II truncated hemoglobin n=1 Tax=Spirosoma sp. TaxID=1899569 RepID=UPI0026044D0D|nr:group II truncated hemoglobin [Spirosoma sp.]MCX6215504.1 group II truncated hemoglobin [Spirosoma sp.]